MRSATVTPLAVNGERFLEDDVSFVRAIGRWLGLVMHRAELVQELVGYAELRGRRELLAQLIDRLSPRQREVAVLIGGGLTNDQIAQRLEVDSRTQVATVVAELGLHRQVR